MADPRKLKRKERHLSGPKRIQPQQQYTNTMGELDATEKGN